MSFTHTVKKESTTLGSIAVAFVKPREISKKCLRAKCCRTTPYIRK